MGAGIIIGRDGDWDNGATERKGVMDGIPVVTGLYHTNNFFNTGIADPGIAGRYRVCRVMAISLIGYWN